MVISPPLKNKFTCIDMKWWFFAKPSIAFPRVQCFSVSEGCEYELSAWAVWKIWLFAQLVASMNILLVARLCFAKTRQQQRWLVLLGSPTALPCACPGVCVLMLTWF